MATAYFVNGSPTDVKVTLNGGDQNKLDPISVSGDGKAVSGPAWGASIKAFPSSDVFGGDNSNNEVLFHSEQRQKTRRYRITSDVSTVLDLYFFMFEDSIVGEDQTGDSSKITIELVESQD
jgi:hypothetical protein